MQVDSVDSDASVDVLASSVSLKLLAILWAYRLLGGRIRAASCHCRALKLRLLAVLYLDKYLIQCGVLASEWFRAGHLYEFSVLFKARRDFNCRELATVRE